jgi:signal transduction histidine kinase
LKLERTDLGSFLKQLMPMMKRTLGGSMRIDLYIEASTPVEVLLDRDQLTTAMLNLSLNARDAQGATGVIRIELTRNSDTLASLTVLDSGVGMTREQIARACEPFYSTKSDGRGNGLGLSMVYGFAKQLGGDLKIISEPGEGTEVRLLLPLASSSADLRVA